MIRHGTLLLLMSLIAAPMSVAKLKKLIWATEVEPEKCQQRAKDGDRIFINFKGMLENGTVFEETFKKGIPHEMQLGKGSVPGLDEGLRDICIGERRKLYIPAAQGYGTAGHPSKVPPDEDLEYVVELLAIGDKTMEIGRERRSPLCDVCTFVVEQFYTAWLEMINKQQQKATHEDGSRMPAITYDQEIDDFVQVFCESKAIVDFKRAPHVRQGCIDIWSIHKRAIVGVFLSADLKTKLLPDKVHKICGDMVKRCPEEQKMQPKKKCESCVAVVDDLMMEMRLLAKHPLRSELWDIVEGVCSSTAFRYSKPDGPMEACEKMMDEHWEALADVLIQDANASLASVAPTLCGKFKMCKAKDLKKLEL